MFNWSCFIIKQYARTYIFSIAQIKNFNGKLCGFLVTDCKREGKGEIFYMYETFTNVLTYMSNKLQLMSILRSVTFSRQTGRNE